MKQQIPSILRLLFASLRGRATDVRVKAEGAGGKATRAMIAPALAASLLLGAVRSEAGTFRVENRLDVPVTVQVAGLDLPEEFRSLGLTVRNTREIKASGDWEYEEGFEYSEARTQVEKQRIFEFDVAPTAAKLKDRPIGTASVTWKRQGDTAGGLCWSGMQDDTPGDRIVLVKVRKDSNRDVKVIRIQYK